ncbi:hypothetical protein BLNAU_22316 [Blattamonas nauphoetae]|uniref:Transmembrane protein n=1 Tax=Blattamonas nauphoetae TaxID=2049346 RepID=A0ABQ9WWG1_9EUKA|nr:hypothetical protein BLNAU_22316 [Blattamonas nauphoetae]
MLYSGSSFLSTVPRFSPLLLASLHCSSLLSTAPRFSPLLLASLHCSSLLSTAPRFSPLLLASLHCSSLLSTAPRFSPLLLASLHCSSLLSTAPRFSPLLLASLHCSSLLSTAPRFSPLLLASLHCSSLLSTAPRFSPMLLASLHCSSLLSNAPRFSPLLLPLSLSSAPFFHRLSRGTDTKLAIAAVRKRSLPIPTYPDQNLIASFVPSASSDSILARTPDSTAGFRPKESSSYKWQKVRRSWSKICGVLHTKALTSETAGPRDTAESPLHVLLVPGQQAAEPDLLKGLLVLHKCLVYFVVSLLLAEHAVSAAFGSFTSRGSTRT